MKEFGNALCLIIAAMCLYGCGSGNGNTNTISNVTFVDKGGVVQSPTTSIISIDSTSVTKTESQAGVIFGSLTRPISFADYTSMVKIINDKGVMSTGDITLAPGEQGCTGWSGMTITVEGVNYHSFDISGAVCDMAEWPAGVRDLITFKDSVGSKYFCSNPAPVVGDLARVSPRYLVLYSTGTNAATETNRLSALYGFTPHSVFYTLGGFAADLSPTALESLRCEPSIQVIQFNGLAYAN